MSNLVWDAAKRFADIWREAGVSVGDISFSTNRYGEHSAYLDIAKHGRFRVSDHSRNENFATERTIHYSMVSEETVAHFIAIDVEATKQAKEAKLRAMAERDEFEAPYKERFLAAPEHDRYSILCEMRPYLASDKAARKEITKRWLEK